MFFSSHLQYFEPLADMALFLPTCALRVEKFCWLDFLMADHYAALMSPSVNSLVVEEIEMGDLRTLHKWILFSSSWSNGTSIHVSPISL